MTPAILLASVLSVNIDERQQIEVGKRLSLQAYITYGRPGFCRFFLVDQRHTVTRIALPIPKGCWMESDNVGTRPVAVFGRGSQDDQPLIYLTLDEESGVYGYRKVLIFRLDCSDGRQIRPSMIGNFEFSDFGSWTAIGKDKVLTWDADLSGGPHEGAHQYVFRWLKVGERLSTILEQRSKKKFNPGWLDNGNRPVAITKENDPLGELGKKWRWWGQRK